MRRHRSPFSGSSALFAVALGSSACARDATWLESHGELTPAADVPSADAAPRATPDPLAPDAAQAVLPAARPPDAGAEMDVDAAVSNPTLTSLAPPCALAVAWSGITFSHPNCESLSGIFDARSAVWDGSRLALSGESWEPIDGRLERLRTRGRGDGSCWRFGESLDWHVTWPVDQCPATALSASYRYEECPLFEGTDVCSATEPTACAVTALATFTPVAQAVVDTPVDAPEDIGCRNLGLDPPRRPAAAGAACFPPWTCAAGHFCSNEQDDGSCALGAAVCQPAPAFDTCGADTEPVCFCGNPAEPLDANVCQLHSLGISLETCLPRPADARE